MYQISVSCSLSTMNPFRLYILMAHEDDPRKCTAARMIRFGEAKQAERASRIPRGAIVLDPSSEQAISRTDQENAHRFGLLAFDCSWNRLEDFPRLKAGLRHRALPFLVPANPTNFGKAQKLSTAEAFVKALRAAGLTREQYEGDRFVRLRWLRHLLESGRLDQSWHWSEGAEVAE